MAFLCGKPLEEHDGFVCQYCENVRKEYLSAQHHEETREEETRRLLGWQNVYPHHNPPKLIQKKKWYKFWRRN